LRIDAALVAAPAADLLGNISGTEGPRACGVLSYPQCDATHARQVIAVSDTLCFFQVLGVQIGHDWVDHVALVPSLGDQDGILSGTTRLSTRPADLEIARLATEVIDASGPLVDGFSLQNGAGGASLATVKALDERMMERGVKGGFASGGITTFHVDMLAVGLFRYLMNVQCFDLAAVASFGRDKRHQGISALMYANPHARGGWSTG
jgi:citrate lyase subunit alpha/citrate CoA-transferase